jgi:hypothetical protein
MAEQLGREEMVSLEDLVVSHAYEMVALVTILEKKGILSRDEIIEEIKRMRSKSLGPIVEQTGG